MKVLEDMTPILLRAEVGVPGINVPVAMWVRSLTVSPTSSTEKPY